MLESVDVSVNGWDLGGWTDRATGIFGGVLTCSELVSCEVPSPLASHSVTLSGITSISSSSSDTSEIDLVITPGLGSISSAFLDVTDGPGVSSLCDCLTP